MGFDDSASDALDIIRGSLHQATKLYPSATIHRVLQDLHFLALLGVYHPGQSLTKKELRQQAKILAARDFSGIIIPTLN